MEAIKNEDNDRFWREQTKMSEFDMFLDWIQDISLTLGKPVDVGGDDEEEEENLGNLLPGGAFESEIFAEDVTVNEYNSEEKINNGTWTCAFELWKKSTNFETRQYHHHQCI